MKDDFHLDPRFKGLPTGGLDTDSMRLAQSTEKSKKITRAAEGMNEYGAMLVTGMIIDAVADLNEEFKELGNAEIHDRLRLGIHLVYAPIIREAVKKLPTDARVDFVLDAAKRATEVEREIREKLHLKPLKEDT